MTNLILGSDIQPIITYSQEDFANWFELGFLALTSPDPNIAGRAFTPMHNILAVCGPHLEGLASMYRALLANPPAQTHFRQGLVRAFIRLGRNPKQTTIQLAAILELCQAIQADELVPQLLSVFANSNPIQSTLIGTALAYLESLSGDANIPSIIHGLLTLPDSPSAYTVSGWLTMCRCDPMNWANHLKLLRPRINQSLADYPDPNQSITAQRFAAFMPLSAVANHLLDLQYFRNKTCAKSGDNWFIQALFNGEDAPYEILRDQYDCFFINDRLNAGDDRIPIATSNDMGDFATDIIFFLSRISQSIGTDRRQTSNGPTQGKVAHDLRTAQRYSSILSAGTW